ncbi:MAG: ribonuclease III [Candidatus Scalindua sp. AMX11]|nr:MAG: ribonuclease III [Candidatus Scalindua sp.]NOG82477.1 ribonuclease III [Planctomycetota bacterium]RZV93910.1 MAG: ribonuclease III [Candidatus Scalindua sp. SCAELEC01]TDE65531.1 MAG: ribonuclease III [Candidatus Scalindua sp. AMX11]GJQ58112.1 MAG: ribonuclease 3 [Candidatus Scalindua sp.]
MTVIKDKKGLVGKLTECQEQLGYFFENIRLLENALTHTSFKTHYNPSNERLEFLGDAVLGMVISEYLFNRFPDYSEGKLTKIKSVVVSRMTLAKVGIELNLTQYISVGKGLMSTSILPKSLIANVLEAIIAAIYLDGGLEKVTTFIINNLENEVEIVCNNQHEKNYKSILQHYCQKQHGFTPKYKIIKQTGPDHKKTFEVVAVLGSVEHSRGFGNCKKDAEQVAAKKTLELFESDIDQQ